MKIMKKILIILMMGLVVLPFSVKAYEKTYNTIIFDQTLSEEEIEHDFSNYKETDDQITIYMFRGKGCGYCRKFLTFLNSIVDDYGKYFKLESYEVWATENKDNADLMQNVATFMNERADGVPFIIIGDKVFSGYTESYDDDIKSAIKELYETKKDKRYDVMDAYNNQKDDSDVSNVSIIVFNIIIAGALALAVAIYDSKKRIDLENRISNLENSKRK